MENIHEQKVLVLDFGSQTTQLIARRVREAKVYCEIYPFNVGMDKIRTMDPRGIILSGGPASVYDKDAPAVSPELFELGIPILGICYGMQLTTHLLKGKVERSYNREYGPARLSIDDPDDIFYGLAPDPVTYQVWMSHGDRIEILPEDFIGIAHSESCPVAAMRHRTLPFFGVQFHPEVIHTEIGKDVLANFLFRICGCTPTWDMRSFVEVVTGEIKARVGSGRIICALSGGVDSTVTALLVNRAAGHQLTSVFVNNGLLRKNEAETVLAFLKQFDLKVHYVDASDRFLGKLIKIEDPEEKRKIIGEEFIRIFEEEARRIGDVNFLAQGTLYPDVIESVSFKGPSATIKSHHNVGGLPEIMQLELIEPLRELFKDEVRKVALELGMPEDLVFRHPFPGPGLAIRILGEVTAERLEVLREADAIVLEIMKSSSWYRKVWQAFAVLLPIRTVGVMGDERTYDNVVAIRVVDSLDAMTADWTRLPADLLAKISNRIINEVRGVNRVCYDISPKPPATIEWE
ncbi:MAG: glutamine-hydrolyzing GMP synthase [Deltaproteobacteria bacterium]|nr:glutamine-hydrolyzing GMP synthase [Deltaproteobacteria bacterium]MBW1966266.1 glutamine-hydrolyzing GMP synthase [Deltaproteobacteria bacterium]MBW2098081.1 glutamine-hydrolyzing GMP synthase [Deltaproteobacteria bacterium]